MYVIFHFVGSMPPGLLPAHKSSIVMFLERVYGIEDQSTFFRLLEDCFLSDLRAATTLDMVSIVTRNYIGIHYILLSLLFSCQFKSILSINDPLPLFRSLWLI